jgi:hypothetical protein
LKKNAANKRTANPTIPKIRNIFLTGSCRRNTAGRLKCLPADLPSKSSETSKNLSIHSPEGGVITLKFRLTRPKNDSSAYDQETYQLTDIGLGLEAVKLDPEAIDLIKKELISVSLRHTS